MKQDQALTYTVAELAEAMKVHERTVRRWIEAGSLEVVSVGGVVRIPRVEFDRITGRPGPSGAAAS